MSANTQTNTVVVAQEKKEKKPTLSAKYSKFLIFGYGFVKSLEAQGALNAEGVEAAFAELKLMSSVEEQTQLYENLLTQSKESGKAMRKFITLRNKPPKAPRAKKPRAKKNAAEPVAAAAATETPPAAAAAETAPALKVKAPRVKKATVVENDTDFDLIGQIVAAANTVEAAPTKTKEEKEAEKKAAKEGKDAEKLAAKEAKEAKKVADKAAKEAQKVTDKAAKEAKKVTDKEAKVAAKTTETIPNLPKEEEEEEVVEEEEIHTEEVVIDGKTYLVDDENNVYSVDTHEPVGTFNVETQTISADL